MKRLINDIYIYIYMHIWKGVLWFNSISNREWGERYLISHHSGDVL